MNTGAEEHSSGSGSGSGFINGDGYGGGWGDGFGDGGGDGNTCNYRYLDGDGLGEEDCTGEG